jgi:S1-C subfamily serine protease
VPINAIKRILRPLIDEGRVVRADLGLARVYRTQDGLLALALVDGGAAERAGIRPLQVRRSRFGPVIDPESADLIVAIGGKPVKTYEDLLNEVEARNPGDQVDVTVIRQGHEVKVPVKLGRSS